MKKGLTKKQTERLRGFLHKLREQLIVDIEKQIGRTLDPENNPRKDIAMDVEELASLDLMEGVDTKILEIRHNTFKNIAESFRRLEAGSYGICEECGQEIPFNRLKAEPFARFCIECLTRIEEFQKAEKEPDRTTFQ